MGRWGRALKKVWSSNVVNGPSSDLRIPPAENPARILRADG